MNKIHKKVLNIKHIDDNNTLILVNDFSLVFNKKLLDEGNVMPHIDHCYTFYIVGNEIKKVEIFTVDLCIFTLIDTNLHLLTITRKHDPYAGCLANPGGFVDEGEEKNSLISANRELKEECNLDLPNLKFVTRHSEEYRDPRSRYSVTDVYSTILDYIPAVTAGDDASDFKWVLLNKVNGKYKLPDVNFAFDHKDITQMCLDKFNL